MQLPLAKEKKEKIFELNWIELNQILVVHSIHRVRSRFFDQVGHETMFSEFPKVDTFLLTFKNLSMGWGKQKKLLIRYMWFFLTKHGLFTSYTCLIGEKWVNVFAQKTMVLLSKCSKLIEVRWENCYWKK